MRFMEAILNKLCKAIGLPEARGLQTSHKLLNFVEFCPILDENLLP